MFLSLRKIKKKIELKMQLILQFSVNDILFKLIDMCL
jgi:hypothetical protein